MARSAPLVLAPPDMPIDVIKRGLDLVPIPAAYCERDEHGVHLRVTNRACHLAGLGLDSATSPVLVALAPSIAGFLDSADTAGEFTWQWGEAIDCRHYRVALARSSSAIRDTCQIYLIDETAEHRAGRSLRREMTTDSLTGLANREGFGDVIEASLAAGDRVAVLIVDLDRFGRLNACLGGLISDELLITVARRIRGTLRGRDTLARLGRDEFAILLVVEEGDEAQQAATRIERVMTEPFRLTEYEISIEASLGIAFGTTGTQAEELVRQAQFAVKRAKTSGRAELYRNDAFVIERERFALETSLRHAIESRALRLNYQPVCDLVTGRIVGVEALARWYRGGEEVDPTVFIPVAEESGLIVPLGRWAIEEATQTLATWDRRAGGNCGIAVAVNLSPIQLQRDNLTAVVRQALANAGLAGERLKLELTESALVVDPEGTAAIMHSLQELGASIAMDDFGTGYSNLALLKKLPIDVLKIDRSLVTGMLADRDKVAIVRAILGLAAALGMKTVAEGVESKKVVQTLASMGCTMGQGFFYSRPLEAEDAWALIAAGLTRG